MNVNKIKQRYPSSLVRFAFQLLVIVIFMFSFVHKAQAEKLKLTTVDWQPFFGHDLPEKGFFSAITREAFNRAGYEIDIEFQPWKRAIETTKKGIFDGLLGAYYNDERAEYLRFSDVVFESKDVFISKDESLISYKDLTALKAYRIGAIRASVYADELKASGYNVVETNDDIQGLRMLLKDRVDLVLMSQTHFKYLLENDLEFYASRDEFVLLDKPYRTNALYCPILKKRENSQKIIGRFNRALQEIKEDGTFKKILKRHKLSFEDS